MRSGRHAREKSKKDNSLTLSPYEPSPSPQAAQENAPSKRSLRGRSGCLNCRRRRKKCDERKPACAKCKRLGEECEWDSGLIFRLSGIDAKHPSMVAGNNATASLSSFQMVDVTFDAQTHHCKEFLNGEELIIADDMIHDEIEPPPDQQSAGAYAWDLELANLTSQHVENVDSHRSTILSPGSHQLDPLNSPSEQRNEMPHHQHLAGFRNNEPQPSPQSQHPSYNTPISSTNIPISSTDLPTIREDDQLLPFGFPEL